MSALKLFISDPKILCRWTFKYSERLIALDVKRVALVRDGVETVTQPASTEKRIVESKWWHMWDGCTDPERVDDVPHPPFEGCHAHVRMIEVEPKPIVHKPWSQIIQEAVWDYLRQQEGHFKGIKGTLWVPDGWGLADYTEAKAREDKTLLEYDAVLCFSDRRIREYLDQDDPGCFGQEGVVVPDHEPVKKPTTSTPSRARSFGRIVSTNMATVTAEPVPWLWPGRVPLGMLTIIAGTPGNAKSWISLYLAGRITTGGIWPDVGKSAPDGTVILLAAEDSAKYTIRPRLDALGADVSKIEKIEAIFTVDGTGEKHFNLTDDLVELEKMVHATGAKLVIVDPLNSYLGGKQDGFKDVEVRRVLDPLKEMAERLDIAVVLIMHLKKGVESEVIYQIGGSVAFAAVVRSILFCSRDPETPGRFYFSHPKINIGVEMPPLSYTISPETGVVWGTDPITLTAREILSKQHAKPGPKQTARREAKQWMVEYLKDGPQTDGWATAAELGFKEKTVRRALEDLCVKVDQVRAGGKITGYRWTMPPRPERPPF